MSSGKCELKQWDTPTHLLWLIKLGTPTTPNARDDVEQQRPSFIAGGNAQWYSHFGKEFGGLLHNWTYFHQFAVNQKPLSQINSFFKHSTFIFDKSIQTHSSWIVTNTQTED